MKIMFIHSGKSYFPNLGPHYGPLIKHSLHLLPLNDYLQLPPKDKNKYRSIESLPTGCIIGIALIDKSFWFNSNQLTNPWSHGPYCYHIADTFRFPKPIQHSGAMGKWTINKNIQNRILSNNIIMNIINEWKSKYNISNSNNIFSAITIIQPFAESIIRNIKDIENRGQKLLGNINNGLDSDTDDGEYNGCRICITRRLNDDEKININYEKYGGQFKKDNIHKQLPKYLNNTDFKTNRRASLIKCACGKLKRKKKKLIKRNKPKLKLKPLHELNKTNNMKNRKPTRRKLNTYRYFDTGNKVHNTRANGKHKIELYNQLINMGFENKNAKIASEKYKCIGNAVDYLQQLENCNENNNNNNKKRKRYEMESDDTFGTDIEILNENNVNKKRKICNVMTGILSSDDDIDIINNNNNYDNSNDNDKALYVQKEYNEENALTKALQESNITYNEEIKCREAVRKSIERKCKTNRKKLSSDMVNTIPRGKC